MERAEVYKLIDEEREYQDRKWNADTTRSAGRHTLEEWFLYIEDYIAEAKHALSRMAAPACDIKASDVMRKVAAMAVSAMEQHGARSRAEEGEKAIGQV